MVLVLAWLSAVALAADIQFTFVGQPDCVAIDYADGVSTIHNGCEAPILVDASVKSAWRPILPGHSEEVRDLSAFTIGLQGELHRAVAVVHVEEEPAAPAEEAGPVVVADGR